MMQTVVTLGSGDGNNKARQCSLRRMHTALRGMQRCKGKVMQGKLYKHPLIQAAGCAASCCFSRPNNGVAGVGPTY